MDCHPPSYSVHGTLQARTLEWDLPHPGIEPRSPALQADSLTSEPPGKPWSDIKSVHIASGRNKCYCLSIHNRIIRRENESQSWCQALLLGLQEDPGHSYSSLGHYLCQPQSKASPVLSCLLLAVLNSTTGWDSYVLSQLANKVLKTWQRFC